MTEIQHFIGTIMMFAGIIIPNDWVDPIDASSELYRVERKACIKLLSTI